MAHQKNQVIVVCENCRKEFSVKASIAKGYRYCSMKCRTEAKTTIVYCEKCGNEFTTYKKNPAKYCSISCGISARNLTDQNPSYRRDISGENNPMFGKGLRGSKNGMFGKYGSENPAWKGGIKNRPDGYVRVVAPADHPYPCEVKGSTKYILEHRLVMERHLGRYLLPSEVVHHIDENHHNNAIDNLRLYKNQSEHLRDAHAVGSFRS
jgi:ribosomal protein L31